jgi:hypothetical protein
MGCTSLPSTDRKAACGETEKRCDGPRSRSARCEAEGALEGAFGD